jgi:DNA polymerase III epsilon subunit-like protein
MSREVFISVDVETSGPIPGEFSLISLGACEVYRPTQEFSCLVKPISMNCDPEALAVTGLSLERLLVDGLPPDAAMAQFAHWVSETCGDGAPVFVGLNAGFDWSFVNYYFVRYHGFNPFGFAPLDIKAMYMGAKGCSWRDTRSSNMKRVLGATSTGTHDALADAQFQAELFRLIRG